MAEQLFDQFEEIEKNAPADWPHKFILCPHIQKSKRPDYGTQFINLVDNTDEGTVTLVLCGVCTNVVTGRFADDITARLLRNAGAK